MCFSRGPVAKKRVAFLVGEKCWYWWAPRIPVVPDEPCPPSDHSYDHLIMWIAANPSFSRVSSTIETIPCPLGLVSKSTVKSISERSVIASVPTIVNYGEHHSRLFASFFWCYLKGSTQSSEGASQLWNLVNWEQGRLIRYVYVEPLACRTSR